MRSYQFSDMARTLFRHGSITRTIGRRPLSREGDLKGRQGGIEAGRPRCAGAHRPGDRPCAGGDDVACHDVGRARARAQFDEEVQQRLQWAVQDVGAWRPPSATVCGATNFQPGRCDCMTSNPGATPSSTPNRSSRLALVRGVARKPKTASGSMRGWHRRARGGRCRRAAEDPGGSSLGRSMGDSCPQSIGVTTWLDNLAG